MQVFRSAPLQELQPVHLRHVEVEEDHLDLGMRGKQRVSFATVLGVQEGTTRQRAFGKDEHVHLVVEAGVIDHQEDGLGAHPIRAGTT